MLIGFVRHTNTHHTWLFFAVKALTNTSEEDRRVCSAALFRLLLTTNADTVQMMRVELVKYNKRYGFAKMRGTCHVGPNLVCEADLNLVMGK